MENRDRSFWTKVISPALRDLVMPEINVVNGVSAPFVEQLPLEECGDFVWAIVCLSRWMPEAVLVGFRPDIKLADARVREALLANALRIVDFHNCPEGGLIRLMMRLKRNVDACAAGSKQEEAHLEALERIEEIVLYVAQRHPSAEGWIRDHKPAKPVSLGEAVRNTRPTKRMRAVPSHLKLVVSGD